MSEFQYRFEPGTSTRTLLVLHGTGGDENSFFPIASALDPSASVLSVRGRVSENGALRFFRRFSEGVYDLEDVHLQANALADFVSSFVIAQGLDPSLVFAAGYSNGANIASSVMLLRPSVLAGALLFRAATIFEPSESVDLSGKRVFLSEGRFDPLVPVPDVEKLAGLLRSAGADVTLHWSDLDHRLASPEIAAAREWLAEPV